MASLSNLRALAGEPDRFGHKPGVTRFGPPYGDMSVSREEADLLTALVKATRPQRILELGTGLGLTAVFLASALPVGGRLWTQEPDDDFRRRAEGLTETLPVEVTGLMEVSHKWPDLVFIDSKPELRGADIERWLTNSYSGLVVVHDADREYRELALGAGVFLPTADGLWVGRGQ